MIARDNASTIAAALASVGPWVDEMIVVDTGSVDETSNIAREMGARVEHFTWCDDFAAARNQSLRYATGQWLFWMDTDDTLPEPCGRQLREMLQTGIPDDVLGLIMQVHCPSSSGNNSVSTHALASGDKQQTRCSTVVDHVKVIRNGCGLKFEGRIHEQVLPSIRQANGRVQWTDFYVEHSGADYRPEGLRRKLARDLRILQKDVQDRPNHPFVRFNLGMTWLHQGEHEMARRELEQCIVMSTTDESHLRKAYVLLSDALEGCGQTQQAMHRCWEGLGRYPNDPELAFKLGRLLMLRKHWNEAVEAFERINNPERKRYFASIDPEIHGFKMKLNLAVCFYELGRFQDSIDQWVACLDENPGLEDAWDGIIQCSRELNEPESLYELASRYQDNLAAKKFVQACKAISYAARQRLPDAIALFETAMKHGDQDFFVLNEFARVLNEHQQWEASLPVLRQLRNMRPTNPSPHFNLGIALRQLGLNAEAIETLQVAQQLRPAHHRTRILLQECRESIERTSTPDQVVLEKSH